MVLSTAHRTLFKKFAKRRPLFFRRRVVRDLTLPPQNESMTNSLHVKLVVAGKAGVGKSLFITSGTSGDFNKISNDDGSYTVPRIGDTGELIYLHIYELGTDNVEAINAENFTSKLTHANAIIAVCDMNDFDSLIPVEHIVEQARLAWTSVYTADSLAEHLPVYIVGNNRDDSKRSMLKTNARLLAVQLDAEFVECSVHDESEVQDVFRRIILKLSKDPNLTAYAYKPPTNASTALSIRGLTPWETIKRYGPAALSVASLGVSVAAMVLTRRPTPQAAGWLSTLTNLVVRR